MPERKARAMVLCLLFCSPVPKLELRDLKFEK